VIKLHVKRLVVLFLLMISVLVPVCVCTDDTGVSPDKFVSWVTDIVKSFYLLFIQLAIIIVGLYYLKNIKSGDHSEGNGLAKGIIYSVVVVQVLLWFVIAVKTIT